MKVLFDHQIFTYMERGGAARYFLEVFRQLKNIPNIEAKCAILLSNNDYVNATGIPKAHSFFKAKSFAGRQKAMRAVNLLASKLALYQGQFDVFHPTYYHPYFINHKIKQPIVLTCLDMIHEKFMTYDKKAIEDKRKSLSRATNIVAISHSTKKDMMEYYNFPEEKIKVIHLASSLEAGEAQRCFPSPMKESFFLFVGFRAGYKNFNKMVEAIAPLLKKHVDIKLHCVGGGKFSKEEIELFNKLKLTKQITQSTVSDEELVALYKHAIAFLFPTLYEGFGIPVLEAMACGCPVITSHSSSLPEVAGEAAIYFDPNNKDSIYSQVELILNNQELRDNMVKKGLTQSMKFSWANTAIQHFNLYRNLL